MPGDYDGDGKTDLGIYCQSDGAWGVLLSGSGYGLAETVFGGPSYDPVWLAPVALTGGIQMMHPGAADGPYTP